MNSHGRILYIDGDFKARQALEAAAGGNCRARSTARNQNAPGTDQLDGDRTNRLRNALNRSVLTLNPGRNR